ncbi:hypothetical protein QYF36_010491 [Acer negundo]|nr:hypothetical protein QYF36_010491 [Acer negundo]
MRPIFRCDNKTELSQRSRHGKLVFLVLKKVNFSEEFIPSFRCQNFLCNQKQSFDLYLIHIHCRSFKNGFVWQDLSENDFIYPCCGNEYILKGSQILEHSSIFQSYETALSSGAKSSVETSSSSEDSNSPATVKKKNHSWSSFSELNVYKIHKAVSAYTRL